MKNDLFSLILIRKSIGRQYIVFVVHSVENLNTLLTY